MAIVEDEGIVLRTMRYRETSRIAVFLTRRFGKVHLIAKAARDIKSPYGGALETLTRSQLIFYLKRNRDLHLLRAAAVERAFERAWADPRSYHLADAALEFVQKVVPDEDPCPEIYGELIAYLDACDRDAAPAGGSEDGGNGAERGLARLKAFQLRVVVLLGYAPQVAACARCGAEISTPQGFGVAEGGLLCPRCPADGEVLSLSPAGVALLRQLIAAPPSSAAPEQDVAAAARTAEREVARVVEAFLRYHLTGYQGLRALKSLTDWLRLDRGA